jgi:maltose alpha-D-glucosyltransferase/alpha-amylase
LTLGSHDFFWLRMRSVMSNPASPYTQAIPVLSIEG